jgi:uncharacterized protein YbbK (DUF523 family)
LPIPRPPAEIFKDRVIRQNKEDVTKFFQNGAKKTLEIAKQKGAVLAIFKEKSPSCGVKKVYDGTFSKTLIAKPGITTALLRQNSIKVISEEDIQDYLDYLKLS